MAGLAAPLALDSAPHGEAAGLRRGEDVIDALAYIDSITQEEQRAAEALIKEEIKSMGRRPADYINEMPKGYQVKFEAEYERVRSGLPIAELDQLRLKCLPPPDNRKNDVAAWHAALDNAHSQLEHQHNRLVNLELLIAYGPKSWQAYIRSLEVALQRLENESRSTHKRVEEVNTQRKLKHQAAQQELVELEARWMALVAKNREIAGACDKLEQELGGAADAG